MRFIPFLRGRVSQTSACGAGRGRPRGESIIPRSRDPIKASIRLVASPEISPAEPPIGTSHRGPQLRHRAGTRVLPGASCRRSGGNARLRVLPSLPGESAKRPVSLGLSPCQRSELTGTTWSNIWRSEKVLHPRTLPSLRLPLRWLPPFSEVLNNNYRV